jgi:methylthioribose-1-phosphate isomerase
LIDGVVTEKGVVKKGSDGVFHFEDIFAAPGSEIKPTTVGGL